MDSANKTQSLYESARKIIPGGTQLFSKRPELHLPGHWPAYFDRADGCELWDLDGKRYIDTSYMGIGACILGYADEDVNSAVKTAIDKGSTTTLNCPEEVELTKLLCEIHPWARMTRFARCGGEAMAIAVRIARAATGKDKILFCGYHGWHDWYLAANLADEKSLDGHLLAGLKPNGVPRGLAGTAIPFKYNDLDGFVALMDKHGNDTAAVVMEPLRNNLPEPGFMETIRKLTQAKGVLLVIDEVTAGGRLRVGGAHLTFDIAPDMAVFAKAMSNGFPMAAIIGTADAMDAAQEAFISSTSWTERIGPTAALATISKMRRKNVPEHLSRIGKKVQEGWSELARKHKLKISVSGMYPLGHFAFEYNNPLVLKTLFTQLMLEKSYLATTALYVSYAHKAEIIEHYLEAVDETFSQISTAIKGGNPEKMLKGPICHAGFERLT